MEESQVWKKKFTAVFTKEEIEVMKKLWKLD